MTFSGSLGRKLHNNIAFSTVWTFVRKGKAAGFFLRIRRAAPNCARHHTLCYHTTRGKGALFQSVVMTGLERWLSSEEHVLLLWIWVQLSAPTWSSGSQLPGTAAPGDLWPPGLHIPALRGTYPHTDIQYTQLFFFSFFKKRMSSNVNYWFLLSINP